MTTTETFLAPVVLPVTAHSYVRRSLLSLREAVESADPAQRYAHAHVSALRAAAALLAARPLPVNRRGRRERNAWVLLTTAAPEFSQWAAFFAAGAATRSAAEAGVRGAVSPEAADALVRDADRFLGEIELALGLMPHEPIRFEPEVSGVA